MRTILGFLSRLQLSFQVNKYDAVLIHKEVFPFGPPLFESIIATKKQNLIYDMDDAFWTHPPQFEQLGKRLRDPKKIQKIIQMSSKILAGNKFIAEYAQRYNPNVVHFPTVLDTDYYEPRNEVDDEFVTIGWVGRWSSQSYLERLLPVFTDLINKYQNLKFRFIGISSDFCMPGVPFERIDWSLQNEITDLIPIDIGIMPLPDDEYSRGKCGFKLLQYMALGIPSIASPVGVNQEIIQNGANGFLASSNEDWFDNLSLLIENKEMRYALGMNGRKTVENHYSLKMYSPELLRILNSFLIE